jgi:hypothetical protein
MSIPVKSTEYWVAELAKLFTEHVTHTKDVITDLENRVTDLEGHIEHGPGGECGICAPETVGADVYVLGVVQYATQPMECAHPTCFVGIEEGDEIARVGTGHSGHNEWRHRDH